MPVDRFTRNSFHHGGRLASIVPYQSVEAQLKILRSIVRFDVRRMPKFITTIAWKVSSL